MSNNCLKAKSFILVLLVKSNRQKQRFCHPKMADLKAWSHGVRKANLHTAPRRHLIKIRTFLIWKNINSQDVLKGLDWTKFLEILHSNKTPNKFSNHQLKIAFKHPNFVREPF